MDTSDSMEKLFSALSHDLSDNELALSFLQGTIAAEITGRRISKNMTQKEFADLLGVSQSTLSKWESGETNFTLSTLVTIAGKLDIEIQSPFVPTPPKNYAPLYNNVIIFPNPIGWSVAGNSKSISYSAKTTEPEYEAFEM